jgi:hypothetical protein
MSSLVRASKMLESFKGGSLKSAVLELQKSFEGATKQQATSVLAGKNLTKELLAAAWLIKKNASQINEIVHALGIMLALPSILEVGERIESISLAAGNTGKPYDLETTSRVAEFTFINWKGGPETIRQNKVFKDFFFLAEAKTSKKRELYTVGTEHVKDFFSSKRSIQQILKGNAKLDRGFRKYKQKYRTVQEYYQAKQNVVKIVDICLCLPQFCINTN